MPQALSDGGVVGGCVLAGTAPVGTTSACGAMGCYLCETPAPSDPANMLCPPTDVCVLTQPMPTQNEQICIQGCDPTGKLGAPACTGGTTCTLMVGSTNPYDGFCQ
jgi:hypothetical protein